ncbi:MAG: hypothetical protein Q4G43_11555 [Mobilicoccus sp.]|nr:hypothetical protein [Mobilicoccus sp.]
MTGGHDDVTRQAAEVRPGDRVRLTYDCGANLSGTVRDSPAGLVLDIPGDRFVVRRPDGTPPPDVVAIVLTAGGGASPRR